MAATLAAIADTTQDDYARCTDDLAADYAGIYLTHAMRAAPYESVWRDEDQLMMQAPTFAVREFYTRHGMVVQNWRHQPDDHLCARTALPGAAMLERGERREAARFVCECICWSGCRCSQEKWRSVPRPVFMQTWLP
jgi:TorA maturation chaperone TorD